MPLADREELAEEESQAELENSVAKAKAARKTHSSANAGSSSQQLCASLTAGNDDAVVLNADDIPLEAAAAVPDPDEALARALQDEEDNELSRTLLSQIHRTEARAWPTQSTLDKVIAESKVIK